MCGIFGVVSRGTLLAGDVLPKAARALAHRGPDDSGTILLNAAYQEIAFAHTRLSIIDLSPLAHQPMQDPAPGNRIVFNGRFHNSLALPKELGAAAAAPNRRSDPERLLPPYIASPPPR